MLRPASHVRRLDSAVLRAGFTLIELLVVIGIVALLAAILLPALSTARQQARRVGCGMNLKSFTQALSAYRAELGDFPLYGIRDGWKMYGTRWRYGDPNRSPTPSAIDDLADIAVAVVRHSLGDPRMMYCPSSLANDWRAPKPYTWARSGSVRVQSWKLGSISYIYLANLGPMHEPNWYPDASGQPTYNVPLESPSRRYNKSNPRTILTGDRVREWSVGYGAGSNHKREGGWFAFTTGDVQWYDWSRLTPHFDGPRTWYWPRTARLAPPFPRATPTN